jgi:hypothetical protein
VEAAVTLVNVTIFSEPIDVPDDDIPVLRSQGLLVESVPETSTE